MDKQGFTKKGCWYKGNLHCHTTQSDGALSPKEVVALYQKNGYHFLCITDHEKYVDYKEQYNSKDFVLLPGAECSVNLIKNGEAIIKTHHINGILGDEEMVCQCAEAYGCEENLQVAVYENCWDGRAAAQAQVDEFRKKGCLVMYNHPIWSKVKQEEFVDLDGLWGIEIYNHSAVFDGGLGLDTRDWDTILEKGKQIYGVATDDNHNMPEIPDSCGGWVMVKAKELCREEIVSNLKKGNFYSSTGPEIYDWGIRDGVAYVDCSPCEQINFVCGGGIGYGKAIIKGQLGCQTEQERKQNREFIEHGEYVLKGGESYIRVECIGEDGKTAWSNAIMLADLR